MRTTKLIILLLLASVATATTSDLVVEGVGPNNNINLHQVGGQLTQAPNYEWWYGCSPTSAGMMMGYYDRNGFSDIVPGTIAELNTYPSEAGWWDYAIQNKIASVGHVADFYYAGNDGYGDDPLIPSHSFNCLADFMGTSQDNLSPIYSGNPNGWTAFLYYNDNRPLSVVDLDALGEDYYNIDGGYGIDEFMEYAGYDTADVYNQYIAGYNGVAEGFTLEQYKSEIDAGRPVLIHVDNHTMFGYGYIDGTDYINVYDTWFPNGQSPGLMAWGETYPYGVIDLEHYGVTVMQPIPEPSTVVILGLGGMFLLIRKLRRIK